MLLVVCTPFLVSGHMLTCTFFLQFKDTVTFSTYSENEIQQILEARVGRSVIAPNVLEYVAKKVSSSTGDARKALEMAANAVRHRLQQTTKKDLTVGHLVKMPNVVLANKEEATNLKERIDGQPLAGKVMLCVLTAYAQAGVLESSVGELKQCVSDCMRASGNEDEMLQMDDFLVLLETLVDSGLLRASRVAQQGNGFSLAGRMLAEVHNQPILLGIQLEELEKLLEVQLKQAFFQNLRERAKNQRKGRD
jgi:Cdc6-like AAA superfamily ATPase